MHLHIVSRKKAKELGLQFYFSATPCLHGKFAARRTTNFQCCCDICIACVRAREASYKATSPKVKAYRSTYHAANRDVLNENKRSIYTKKRETLLANTRAWRKDNSEHLREYKRKTGRSDCAKRRAAKRERLPTWFGEFDRFVMDECADLAAQRTVATGIEWHVDHMIPLSARKACGLHCGANLQVIPAYLNLQKQNRLIYAEPGEWLAALI